MIENIQKLINPYKTLIMIQNIKKYSKVTKYHTKLQNISKQWLSGPAPAQLGPFRHNSGATPVNSGTTPAQLRPNSGTLSDSLRFSWNS